MSLSSAQQVFQRFGILIGLVLSGVAHAGGLVTSPDSDDQALHRYAVLHRFDYRDEGWQPGSGLVQGKDGSLFGANRNSSEGHWHTKYDRGCGLIYRIAPDGQHATVFDFSDRPSHRGCRVIGELLLDSGGLYGTTLGGGPNGHGTVFRLSLKSKHQILHSFDGADGDQANGGLVRGVDGALYGTTNLGGAHGQGTVFKIAPDGTFTSLYSFRDGDPMGQRPADPLTLGPDGLLYGAATGGRFGKGTLFRLTTDGQMSLVRAFRLIDGEYPNAMTAGRDGWLYGTTMTGGSSNLGTLFRLSVDGQFETLHSFNGQDGSYPQVPPTQDAHGTWYGTTTGVGADDARQTLYRVRFDGSEPTIVHEFGVREGDGSAPFGRLLIGRDGGIYGATAGGGSQMGGGFGAGTVYRQGP